MTFNAQAFNDAFMWAGLAIGWAVLIVWQVIDGVRAYKKASNPDDENTYK